LPRNVALCGEHAEQVDAGARWFAPVPKGQERNHLLMGADAPPVLTNFHISTGHMSNEVGSHLVTVFWDDADGHEERFEFELTEEQARNLGAMLG
jgi:hypothetical protein